MYINYQIVCVNRIVGSHLFLFLNVVLKIFRYTILL